MRALLAGLLVAAPVSLPPAAQAAPASPVVLSVAQTYAPSDVQVARGSSLTLVNADADRHDITALDEDALGRPLFETPVLSPGQAAPVAGVESLPPDTYQFFCSVHEYMRGTVTVA
ncbi:MAG TPA: cupredoxin domain-containing protein [Frankiaceae bacterium]|nr:cupredoxin domain-containing protein [Frankiaceae bacterium]